MLFHFFHNIILCKKDTIQNLEEENKMLKLQVENLKKHYDEDCKTSVSAIAKRLLFTNLNEKHVFLIDFENITMIPKFILEDKQSVCYIFSGIQQQSKVQYEERIQEFQGIHYNVPTHHTAKNSLDTLLSFYLGQIYSGFTPESVYVVSDDKDYENLRRLSLHYPQVHYEQITLNEIKRKQQNVTSDDFYKRFLLDYIHAFPPQNVSRDLFAKRLRSSKVHGMDSHEVQYALKRMNQLHLIEEHTIRGKRYVRLFIENISKYQASIPKFETKYVY